MNLRKKIKRKDLQKEILRILQGLINITERERQLLLLLMKVDAAWSPAFEGQYKDILSTDYRRLLCKEANMNKANLTMYTKSLFKKGCLVKNSEGGVEINKMLVPEITGDIVEYVFTLDMGE